MVRDISMCRVRDGEMNDGGFRGYMCEEWGGKDDDEGEMEWECRRGVEFCFDDVERREGRK